LRREIDVMRHVLIVASCLLAAGVGAGCYVVVDNDCHDELIR